MIDVKFLQRMVGGTPNILNKAHNFNSKLSLTSNHPIFSGGFRVEKDPISPSAYAKATVDKRLCGNKRGKTNEKIVYIIFVFICC